MAPNGAPEPVGVGQGVADGQAHVGHATAGPPPPRRRTPPSSGRSTGGGRPLDAVVGDAEQLVGLDDLEALVHQRGGVDGDLRAHRPGRMGQGLVDADRGQLVGRPAPERPARGGEQQPGHVVAAVPARRHWWTAQCSESTGTISAPGVPRARWHDRRPGDERLLVGQGQAPAGLEGGQGHRQPGEADHAVDDHVGQAWRWRPGPRARPAPRCPAGSRSASSAAERGVADGHHLGPERAGPGRPAGRPSAGRRGPPPRTARGRSATTSRAWVPIDPVEPTRLTVTGRRSGPASADIRPARAPWSTGSSL